VEAAVTGLLRGVGDKSNIEVKIAQIAARQQRNVTREQLLAMGVAGSSIAWRVKKGRLYRVHPGVYSIGAPPITPLERVAAAVLACGPRAALSHGSAMTLWGFWKRWDRPFEVTVATDRRPRGVRVHRSAGLERRDFRTEHGIRVTSVARTVLDCAPRMRRKTLTRVLNDARRSGHLHLDALADIVARFPLHPGAPLLKPFVGTTQAPTRSGFEDDFLEFCRRFGLPTPRMNTFVAGHEVDALFPQEKVIVELDSWRFHSNRGSFEGDRRRDTDTLMADHVTVRLTDERFDGEPHEVAAQLHAILAQRRGRAA
jgi:hypothetical protein